MSSRNSRPSPILAAKLRTIRLWLGLTQEAILALVAPQYNQRSRVSMWELGDRDPYHEVLLRYAELAGISVDILIDNNLSLPDHIVAPAKKTNQAPKKTRKVKSKNKSQSKPFSRKKSKRTKINSKTTNQNNIDASDAATSSETIEENEDQSEKNSHNEMNKSPKNNHDDEYKNEHHDRDDHENEDYPEPKMFTPDNYEEVTHLLSSSMLDEVSDILLELSKLLPRRLRKDLTVEKILTYSMRVLIYQHRTCPDKSLLAAQVKSYAQEDEPQPSQ